MARPTGGARRKNPRRSRKPASGAERAAAKISRIPREESLETTLKIGKVVYERIFGGQSEAVRRGRMDSSFRKLADDPAMPPSRASLWRACGTYELSLRWPALLKTRHLTPSHIRAALGLPAREQRRLLARAEKESWTAVRLDARAAPMRHAGGRPRKSEVTRFLDSVRLLLSKLPSAARDARGVKALGEDEAVAGIEAMRALREKLPRLESAIQRSRDRRARSGRGG